MRAGVLRIAFEVLNTVLTCFCVGFTTIALLTYFDDGAVDLARAVTVGVGLALVMVVRFIWDARRDARESRTAPD